MLSKNTAVSYQSPTDRALSEYAEIGYQCESTPNPLCPNAGLLETRMVQMKVMRSTRIRGWSMLEEEMNWECPREISWISWLPFLVLWSTKALIVGHSQNNLSRFLFWSKFSQFRLWLYTTSKIIDNLSSFCYREWLLPLLQSGMSSNRISDSAPLPLKSGIYHRHFQIDDEEAQCCRHSLMLCRILHPTNSSAHAISVECKICLRLFCRDHG